VLGWCVAETGDPDRGLGLLTEAIAALRATHSRHFLSYLVGLLAEAQMKAGQHADAMKAVDDGIALADARGERYYSAELHRLHGELLARPPHGQKGPLEPAVDRIGREPSGIRSPRPGPRRGQFLSGPAGRRSSE
jgi:predicted ATPase